MTCPNCNESMNYVNLDNQHLLHCSNCGGSFFDINSINRISVNSAQKLNEDKKTDEIFGKVKLCPKDKTTLTPIQDEETIPTRVTLLKCPKCQGVFTYPEDLINFKNAQVAKINYFKAWNKPLPSLKSILVLSFVGIIAASVFASYFTQQDSISQTQANNLVKKVYISISGQYVTVSFRTEIPMKSEIAFKNMETNEVVRKIISNELTTFHYITTGNINPNDNIFYQIILFDNKGNVVRTDTKKLE